MTNAHRESIVKPDYTILLPLAEERTLSLGRQPNMILWNNPRVRALCQTFGYMVMPWLLHQINENAANLSGGEKQKLSILRALLKAPDVIVLDEHMVIVQAAP